MAYVVALKDVGKGDKTLAGKKGALLGEAFNIAPVPNGFVLKTTAFQRFVSLKREALKGILIDSSIDDEEKAEKIAEIIESLDFPKDVHKEIVDAYESLSVDYRAVESAYDLVKTKSQIPVVVRSNLFWEKDESFMESTCEINVMGADALIKAIKVCWADFFNEEVVEFLVSENIDFDDIKIACLVQKMVYAHKAGVFYTSNPDTGDDDEILVEACWGMDDYFMLDENEPNSYVVDKDELKIKETDVKPQNYAYLVDKKTGETMKKTIPENERGVKVLKDDEIIKLANIAKKLEQHFDEELEIEFIIERDKVYITQINFFEEEEGDEEYGEAEDYEKEGEDLEEVDEVEEPEEAEEIPSEEEGKEKDYYLDEAEKEVEEKESKEDFEDELREMMARYIAINPNLKKALELLEKDILELYKRMR